LRRARVGWHLALDRETYSTIATRKSTLEVAMTDEEFERLKAAEKEHLRAKKKLQATLKQLRQKKQVRSAVDRLARSAQSALDRASELIDRLASETARDEARLDVALDPEAADPSDASGDEAVAAYEAERSAEQARALVRQMKQAQRIPSTPRASDSEHAPANNSRPDATSSEEERSTSSSEDLPEKTIGRMR
jgi:hypothetical protein